MKRKNPERIIQIAVAEHLRKRGVPGLVWFHVPNAPRNAIQGSLLKRMGMRSGVSDLILFHSGELFALEIKAPGGRATSEQTLFLRDIATANGFAEVGEGLDACLVILKAWGLIR